MSDDAGARARRIEELAHDPDPLRELREAVRAIPDTMLAQIAALEPLLADVGFMMPPAVRPMTSDIGRLVALKRYLEDDAWLNGHLATLGAGRPHDEETADG